MPTHVRVQIAGDEAGVTKGAQDSAVRSTLIGRLLCNTVRVHGTYIFIQHSPSTLDFGRNNSKKRHLLDEGLQKADLHKEDPFVGLVPMPNSIFQSRGTF